MSRIQGADRYATAAAIGSELGGGSSWWGGDEPAAIPVNGGDVSLAYAMMVGPLAYRLEVPVLLTARRSLPAATAEFLRTEDIEHVVIVGGTGSVADSVEAALVSAGVDDIDRVAGDSAAGTSVELAELAMGRCAADLRPVSEDTVALVHSDALPDGVAAAPVLAATFADGDVVPMLLVNDTLPTPTLTEMVTSNTPPTRMVRYEFQTALVRFLPKARDLVGTAAGHQGAEPITGSPAYSRIRRT